MRLVTDRGLFHFGVLSAGAECLTISTEDGAAVTATAPPGEADSFQLRAAERLGFFPYADAADHDGMKGHAA